MLFPVRSRERDECLADIKRQCDHSGPFCWPDEDAVRSLRTWVPKEEKKRRRPVRSDESDVLIEEVLDEGAVRIKKKPRAGEVIDLCSDSESDLDVGEESAQLCAVEIDRDPESDFVFWEDDFLCIDMWCI